MATAKYRNGGKCRLNIKTIAKRIEHGRCELTGLRFRVGDFDDLNSNPYAPSLDRIDPDKSYITRNIQVTLWSINRFRSDMKMDDFSTLLNEIRSS